MSGTDTPDPPPDPAVTMTDAPAVSVIEPASSRKSYRRKYRKIMVSFERKMQESNGLFRDEQKIFDISQRLAEQTDQLLQLLVDLNSMPHVPQRLRYDLSPQPNTIREGHPDTDYDEESAHKALRKARYQLQTGEITPHDYEKLKIEVVSSPAFAPGKSYATLRDYAPKDVVASAALEDPDYRSGFLTVKQEDQYLHSVDAYLDGLSNTPRAHARSQLSLRTGERNMDKEKELQIRNPVSVYNWLRKNQPQVFLQDEDSKPSRTTGTRNSKRNSTRDAIIKQEQELYDEDGIAVDVPSNRNKRKRDVDGGYRPKGGNNRATKRKRESKASIG
jgi:hypothetical protein